MRRPNERETILPDSPVDAASSSSPRYALALTLILIAAAALRIGLAGDAAIISPDSSTFIGYSQQLSVDPIEAMRSHDQHPLYPALIALAHALLAPLLPTGSAGWIAAGVMVAIIGGVAAVWLMFHFGRGIYDVRVGLMAAAGFAFLPDACRFSADALSDLPHAALYLAAVCALLPGLSGRMPFLPLAGLLSGLAFLTRPEGASAAVAGIGLVLLLPGRSWRGRLVGAVLIMIGFGVAAGPYQLITGQLVQKKSLLELFMFGVEPESACLPPFDHFDDDSLRVLADFGPDVPREVLYQWMRSSRVIFFIMAGIGLLAALPRRPGGAVLAATVGLHLLLLHALLSSKGYVDRRHALLLTMLTMPLAARGIVALGSLLAGWLAPRRTAVFQWGCLLSCVAFVAPYTLRRVNAGDAHLREAADWIRAHTPAEAVLVTDQQLRRVALYAERPFALWPWWGGGVDNLDEFIEREAAALGVDTGGCYLAFDERWMFERERNPRFFEQLAERYGSRLELVLSVEAPPWSEPTVIRVYHLRAAPTPGVAN